MFKVKIVQENVAGYSGPVWSYDCPLCNTRVPRDLLKEYVEDKVIQHLADFHRVFRSKMEIVYKKRK